MERYGQSEGNASSDGDAKYYRAMISHVLEHSNDSPDAYRRRHLQSLKKGSELCGSFRDNRMTR
jgi:hypothetical protein